MLPRLLLNLLYKVKQKIRMQNFKFKQSLRPPYVSKNMSIE
jgi:hypothetical protein